MTTVSVVRAATAAAERAVPRAKTPALVAVAAGTLTLLIRLALRGRAFDLFGDEVIYADTGHSVTSGGFPRFQGQVFFLHGPGFFYLEAGWEWLWGRQPGLAAQIYEMRSLNALLAAATAVVLVLLAVRAGSLRAGVVAGLLFALDPFCIRQNDRVLLETGTMLWVLAGYLAFASLIRQPPPHRASARAVGAGLLFGAAVLTKDEAVLLTILPLLAAAWLRWRPRRGLILLTVGTTAAVYAVYVAVVAANGYFGALWTAKTSGVLRLLGLVQITGFHSSKGGSLAARLIAEGPDFVTTYLLLVLAVLALVPVLLRGDVRQRIVGLLYCAAAVTLGYALILGTLEEQELYLLEVPSVLIIPVAATLLGRGSQARRRCRADRQRFTAMVTAAVALTVGLNLITAVAWFRQPDDGFARLSAYMTAHIPAGVRVTDAAADRASSAESAAPQVALALGSRYGVGFWVTPAARSKEHVQYVVVPWAEIDHGYSYLSPAQVRQLVAHGRLVFSFYGRTYGDLELYRLPLPQKGAR